MARTATEKRKSVAEGTAKGIGSILPAHQEFYDLGLRVRALAAGGKGRKAAAREIAAGGDATYEAARKASLFVDRYTQADLTRLSRSKTSKGQPIPRDMLIRLATVEPALKKRLLAGIASGRWCSTSFRAAIRRLRGDPRPAGGPRLTEPIGLAGLLEQIERRSRDWLERHDRVWREAPALTPREGGLDGPDELAEGLARIRAQLRGIAKSASRLEARLARLARAGRGSGSTG